MKNKRNTAERYQVFCANNKLDFILEPTNANSNYWLNAILLANQDEKISFLEFTDAHGIMCRPVWTLLNELPMFKSCFTMELTNSKWLADRLVNIPSSVKR